MTDTGPMTKGERDELRRLVRAKMKVLRGDVDQRQAEMEAEAAARVRDRYTAVDTMLQELNQRLGEILADANRQAYEAINALGGHVTGHLQWEPFTGRLVTHRREDRWALQNALGKGIVAEVGRARREVDRQEADLLERLAMGALETDAAREFVAAIPAVAQLVPRSRLAELEQAWAGDNPGDPGQGPA